MQAFKPIKIKSKNSNYSVYFSKLSKKLIIDESSEKDIFIVDSKVYKKHNLNKYLNKKNLILVNASENEKDFNKLSIVIKKILSYNFNKKGKLIVIGGGITQDIVSFISSIIFRGVEWIFLPTSLLAQCDSCIGGKTSINFYGKKNQLGNFNPPKKIFIDINFLSSQSTREIRSGIGEMSHYYFVSKKKDFLFFKENYKKALNSDLNVLKKLIYNSLKIKKGFIEKDEFDTKERLILNYGHTFGHAIEAVTDYGIPHGIAVANGINIANFISLRKKYIKKQEYNEMKVIVDSIYKNDYPKNLNIGKYLNALRKDKKNINKNLTAILTRGIGKMFIQQIKFDKNLTQTLEKYKSKYLL